MNSITQLSTIDLRSLPEGKDATSETQVLQEIITTLEGWLALKVIKASPEEKFSFARKRGFVSETHLNFWIVVADEYFKAVDHFNAIQTMIPTDEIQNFKKELEYLRRKVFEIRDKSYYQMIMHRAGKYDYSPSGEDLLR